MTAYRPRSIGPRVDEALREMPVVVISGMRQTGKSTLLQHESGLGDRLYLSLDDFAQLEAARRDPEAFVSRDEPVTIDEVQKSPELLAVIKREVDRDRRPGRFLLSGSANLALLRSISESLAGRAIYLILHPFTRREIEGQAQGEPFVRSAFQGGQTSATLARGSRDLRGDPERRPAAGLPQARQ